MSRTKKHLPTRLVAIRDKNRVSLHSIFCREEPDFAGRSFSAKEARREYIYRRLRSALVWNEGGLAPLKYGENRYNARGIFSVSILRGKEWVELGYPLLSEEDVVKRNEYFRSFHGFGGIRVRSLTVRVSGFGLYRLGWVGLAPGPKVERYFADKAVEVGKAAETVAAKGSLPCDIDDSTQPGNSSRCRWLIRGHEMYSYFPKERDEWEDSSRERRNGPGRSKVKQELHMAAREANS